MRSEINITYAITAHKHLWNENKLDDFGNITITNVQYWWCGTKGWLKDDEWAIVKRNKKYMRAPLKIAKERGKRLSDIHIVQIATKITQEFYRV